MKVIIKWWILKHIFNLEKLSNENETHVDNIDDHLRVHESILHVTRLFPVGETDAFDLKHLQKLLQI